MFDNRKPIVAIIAGGDSGEREVSLRSAAGIYSWIDRELFEPYIFVLSREVWQVELPDGDKAEISRADMSFEHKGCRLRPDYAYITIHGTPGENGILQGYLELLSIPYNTGGVLTEALTFNKYYCNRYLASFEGIRVAKSLRLVRGEELPEMTKLVEALSLPLFVKPNTGGSSVATSRVERVEELEDAIHLAFSESEEVMLERLIEGVEVTCGAYKIGDSIEALPITEVVTHNKFFDFNAKYHGEVEEITPARILPETTTLIQSLTKAIYGYTDARGIIRVDYIIESDGLPTLLEVNTTPGMTPTSFIPQQVRAAGLEMTALLSRLIAQGLSK